MQYTQDRGIYLHGTGHVPKSIAPFRGLERLASVLWVALYVDKVTFATNHVSTQIDSC